MSDLLGSGQNSVEPQKKAGAVEHASAAMAPQANRYQTHENGQVDVRATRIGVLFAAVGALDSGGLLATEAVSCHLHSLILSADYQYRPNQYLACAL